jgi:hypothetical protein
MLEFQIRGQERRGDIYLGNTAVMGMLDRDLRKVRCTVIPNTRREYLAEPYLEYVHRTVHFAAALGTCFRPFSHLKSHPVVGTLAPPKGPSV